MIIITDKHNCCGCESCVQACPKHCISFDEDTEGFRYPYVDKDKCIDCGLCEKVCPVQNRGKELHPLFVFAAKNDNEKERKQSSSGGIFILLSKEIIRQGGVVFGAKFDENWEVKHDYAETIEEVKSFMGSKYVQSRVGNTYLQARQFLETGRKVLYSGTPCQIAGLKCFLRKDYGNLLTVDIICHGVPSPKVWRRYLDEIKHNARQGENTVSSPLNHFVSEGNALETSNDVCIKSISFRDKRLGWKKFSFALTLAKASADGKKNSVSLSHIYNENPFIRIFLGNISLRPSCFQCPVKAGRCNSDITLADFWGIQSVKPEIDDDKGTSLILINTQKGTDFFYRSKDISYIQVTASEALKFNPVWKENVKSHPNRMKFFKKIDRSESIIKLTDFQLRKTFRQHLYDVQICIKVCIWNFLHKSKDQEQ